MVNYHYDNFVKKISDSFTKALNDIEAEYNFDLGDEFEIALCKTLRKILPNRYGICRGFAIDSAGNTAGDDILIFERIRFPTIRNLEESFAQKEKIPIESVFAYIEAKHTLEINGGSNNSLKKALLQISKVKELVLQRTPVGRNQLSEFVVLGKGFTISEKPGWPSIQNPPYGMLLARQVRINTKSQLMTSPDDIHNALVGSPVESNILPDLIVAGPSNFILPVNQLENKQEISSPFFLFENNNNIYHPKSILSTNKVDGIAFGIALAHLFWALDHINLGVMPWEKILGNGMQVEKS